MKKTLFIALQSFAVSIAYQQPAWSYFERRPEKSEFSTMNGIDFSDYKDFYKDWQLVTSRFRRDSQEIRLVYANPKAWTVLSNGQGNFPEGAVIAKVAFKTEADQLFLSSEVPSNARRYQIMIKDSKKYNSTGGWGYALFDSSGVSFSEPVDVQTKACFSCHQIASSRDYVFSTPMPIVPGANWIPNAKEKHEGLVWKKVKLKTQPLRIRTEFDDFLYKEMNSVFGKVKENFFSGTLDEMIPALLSESRKSALPSIFFGDSRNFSLVIPKQQDGQKCFRIIVVFKSIRVKNQTFCD